MKKESDKDSTLGMSYLCPICFGEVKYRGCTSLNSESWVCDDCGSRWKIEDLLDILAEDEYEEA